MALSKGTLLGPYAILAPLGAGGMGEVYRARDTRLGRQVAVKVLPPELAGDADRLRRFEQEAQSVAALNHPNILTLYDVGTASGVSFLVTELLEGRSLRQLLSEERLSANKAIAIAAAMADGLAAAHARGVVHRDLKPENVFVTTDGQIKLLDFGLAKAAPVADASGAETQAATATAMILGTPGYMAPEQARAQTVDSRSDVFAFGAVLYEMLAGHQAFGGATPLDRISAVLRDPPPPIPSNAERPVPVALLRIVERCLEKSPSARFQSTPDLAFALKTVSTIEPAGVATAATPAPTARAAPSSRSTLLWSLTIAGILVVSGYVAWLQNQRAAVPPPSVSAPASAPPAASDTARQAVPSPSAGPPLVPAKPAPAAQAPVTLPVPPPSAPKAGPAPIVERRTMSLADAPLFAGGALPSAPLAISHDGTRVVYVGIEPAPAGRGPSTSLGSGPALYVRGIDDPRSTRLAGTEGATAPFFSPDDKSIGFVTDRVLKRIPAAGGPVVTIATAAGRIGGAGWGPDDRVVYGPPLFRVPASGGTPEDLRLRGAAPQVLPGGAMLFTAVGEGQPPRAAVRLADASVRDLVGNAANPRYVPSIPLGPGAPGFLVYAQGPTLFGAPFDASKLVVTGPAVALVQDLQSSPAGWSGFAVSANGTLAYVPGTERTNAAPFGRTFAWIDSRDGRETPWPVPPRWYAGVQLSPDNAAFLALLPAEPLGRPGRGGRGEGGGGRFARANAPGAASESGRRLVAVSMATGAMTVLTDASVAAFAWMPDSRRAIFAKMDGSLYLKRIDGGGEEQLRPVGSVFAGLDQIDVAPDGRTVIWSGRSGDATGSAPGVWTLTGLDPNAPAGGTNGRVDRLPAPPGVGVMTFPRISPDGKWLGHLMNRQGRTEVMVKPFGSPGAFQVATDANPVAPQWHGNQVVWQRNGQNGIEIMTADVPPPANRTGPPRLVYAPPAAGGVIAHAVAADGRRVAVSRGEGMPVRPEITLVFNILTALRRP